MPSHLILIRHGESLWNQINRFTGWVDVDLSPKGVQEAQKAAKLLKEKNWTVDRAYTSLLKRAIKSLWILLEEMDCLWVPVEKTWRLNERHYGQLQGLDKNETVEKYGKEKVFQWRRGYKAAPPSLLKKDAPWNRLPYSQLFTKDTIPLGESLETCQKRVLPFWHSHIKPSLTEGQKILVMAHGNSLRALIQFLDQLSEDEISKINIETGVPLVYKLDKDHHPLKSYGLE